MAKKRDIRIAAHYAKVRANENEVIAAAHALDPKDRSPQAEYVREVAADIIARRAIDN